MASGRCDLILFWISRSLPDHPGLTTNVEFGQYVTNPEYNVIYGRPHTAEKVRYLDWLWRQHRLKQSIFVDLLTMLNSIIR